MSKVNLNLLVALDALLTECNVTRAGQKIFLTQSAMSNALNQLREIFQDELLIRSSNGMMPTKRALALQPKVKELLNEINHIVFDEPRFDPKTSARKFILGMSDYAEFCIMPCLLKLLTQEAPHIEIVIKHLNVLTNDRPIEIGEIELGIGCGPPASNQISYERLFNINAVVIARKNHPLMRKKMSLADYLNATHIRILFRDSPEQSKIDQGLQKLNVSRKTIVTAPHMLPALFALKNSDLIVTTPNFLHQDMLKQLNLAMQPTPFAVETLLIQQAWHNQFDQDPGHQWLRQIIKKAVSQYNRSVN